MLPLSPLSYWTAFFFTLFPLTTLVQGHSKLSPPIRRFDYVTSSSIQIFPRVQGSQIPTSQIVKRDAELKLRNNDSHRLQFNAFNQTFYLHLEPNDHILHESATMTLIHPDGSSSVHSIRPEEHRIYRGVVLTEEHTDWRLKEDIAGINRHFIDVTAPGVGGWARILVHSNNLFEGAFTWEQDTYHIRTIDNYHRTKQDEDPIVLSPDDRHPDFADAHLIVFRDSDTHTEEDIKKSHACKSSTLSYNTNPNHPIHKMRYQQTINRLHTLQTIQMGEKHLALHDRFSLDAGHGLQVLDKRQDTLGGKGGSSADLSSTIGSTAGCPRQQVINYMGVAADCTYVSKYGDSNTTRVQILNDWNMASALYENSFNVSLGIVNMVIRAGGCPTTVDPNFPWNRDCSTANYDINNRLSDFSRWRGTLQNDTSGLWHLMTNCNTGSEIGVAWLGELCTTKVSQSSGGQSVSGTGVSTAGKAEWKIVAHEIGHGFGAVHDCTSGCSFSSQSQCCPLTSTTCDANAQFIMNPTSGVASNNFSPCTIGNICSALGGGQTSMKCLVPVTKKSTANVLNLKQCGNGIVEDGEDCDCGGQCTEAGCCDATTCKFKNGAVCDDVNDLCCNQCQFKPANTTCRDAISGCDVIEICTGTSGQCPDDKFQPNGQSCGNGLTCASGHCTSRDQQCQQRGQSLNITKKCQMPGDSSCYINCQDPNISNQCIELSAQLPDGISCGYGGACNSGKCVSSNDIINVAKSWVTQNPRTSIPVLITGGLFVLLLGISFLYCLCGCCRRDRYRDASYVQPQDMNYASPAPPVNGSRRLHRNGSTPSRNPTERNNNWVDPTPYNGSNQLNTVNTDPTRISGASMNSFLSSSSQHQLIQHSRPPPI